jgi:CheY-like chemotaxis protein
VNGLEALDQLDRTVDILVLDRRLPRISGPEIVNRLSETSFDGEIIVISAYSPDGYLDECDVTRYITKPIMRDEFLRELRQTV